MMVRAATLFAALLALSLPSAADDKKEDPKSDEKLLVGKWKLVKLNPGELPEGVEIVLDVQKDGKFKITVTSGGEKDVNEGTWKLDKKKFAIEFTEGNRKGNKQTDTVKELTEKKLVLLDERDITEEWERVPEKKEKGDK
jgi:uncharacterized protein (TIGR03066 family)